MHVGFGCNPGMGKEHLWKNWQNPKEACSLFNNVLLMLIFLVLAKVPCLCKMLALLGAG